VPKDLLSQIESDFLREFEHAEELAKTIEPGITFIFIMS
jgi:serine/threonine-protein kinase ULK/ATG1